MNYRKTKTFIVSFAVVLGILSVSLCLNDNKVINVALDKLEAIAGDETSGTSWKGYVNNSRECVVKEVYECVIGFTIPNWVPYIGGMECYTTYYDEVESPGTINDCIYTGNENQMCDYYRCTKN